MMPTISLVTGALSVLMLCLYWFGMGSVLFTGVLGIVAVVTGIFGWTHPRARTGFVIGLLGLLPVLILFAAATLLMGTGGDWSR